MDFEGQRKIEQDFSDKELPEINSERLKEIEKDPGFRVRVQSFENIETLHRGKIDGDFRAEDLAQKAQASFKELTSKYGVDVPVDFFVGNDEKKGEVIYSVVPEISGKDLANRDGLKEIGNPIQDLYAAVSKYYLDKLRNGDFFLVDISGASQYVFGRKKSEIEGGEKLYLVDTDILLDNRRESLPIVIYWMCRHLATIEKWLDSKNDQARKNIEDFLDEYTESEEVKGGNNDRLLEIKEFLKGKEFGPMIKPAIPLFED